MTSLTNLVQFPGLGLEFTINRVAFSIGEIHIYWYGVCIAVGLCLALVFAFRHCQEFGVDPDAMVDVILIGVVLGIASARAYYVAMAPFAYESIWEMLAIRDGGLAIYGGIIGGFLFGGLACKWRGVPVLPMFDLTAMGFLIGQGCGRWGNFFNQEAFGCNTTLPWGMYSEATRNYLMGSTVTAQKGVVIDPNLPVHPTFLYESIWCFVGFALLYFYRKKRKFNGDITLRYLIWYGAGRFWIEALRTDSLMLVPSIGLRVSQLVAGLAVVVGLVLEIYMTRKDKDKPLMVPLALNADNRAKKKKLDGPIAFFGPESSLPASASRAEFLEKTAAWTKEAGEILDETLARQYVQLPGTGSRNGADYQMVTVDGREYLKAGDYLCAPASGLGNLYAGAGAYCTILEDGYARWFHVGDLAGKTLSVTLSEAGGFTVYDANGAVTASSVAFGDTSAVLPEGGWIVFAGEPGARFYLGLSE